MEKKIEKINKVGRQENKGKRKKERMRERKKYE